MNIHVTLPPSDLAESGLSASELQAAIVGGLNGVSPALPGFNVSIVMSADGLQNSSLEQPMIALPIHELGTAPAKHRLLQDFDYQGISIRFITPNNGSVYLTVSSIPKLGTISKFDFWTDVHQHSLMAALIALKLFGKQEIQIKDIVRTLSEISYLRAMVTALQAKDSAEDADAVEWLNAYLQFWYDNEEDIWNGKSYRMLLQHLAERFLSLVDTPE
jgi:hypothetical protein